MTHKVTGVVDSAFTKSKMSKAGKPFTVNYVTVGDVTYSTGFDAVHTEGQMVDIAVKWNYGEWQYLKGVASAGMPDCTGEKPVKEVTTGSFGGKGGSRGKFPIDKEDGQMSIIRQSSMNRAVDLVDNMITSKVITIPASKDEYMAMVINVALIVTDFGSGQDIMKLKAAMASNIAVANG